jgi:hypothetical protein
VGFGIPLGSASGVDTSGSVSDYSSFTIPVQLDIGARIAGVVFVGGYFSYGFAGSTDTARCLSGFSCSPSTLRFGAEVHWHPLGNVGTDPWIGIGSGYESLRVGLSGGGDSGSYSLSGWEFGNLQAGLDFALGPAIKLGPWISFSIGQYSSFSGSGHSLKKCSSRRLVTRWVEGGVWEAWLPSPFH